MTPFPPFCAAAAALSPTPVLLPTPMAPFAPETSILSTSMRLGSTRTRSDSQLSARGVLAAFPVPVPSWPVVVHPPPAPLAALAAGATPPWTTKHPFACGAVAEVAAAAILASSSGLPRSRGVSSRHRCASRSNASTLDKTSEASWPPATQIEPPLSAPPPCSPSTWKATWWDLGDGQGSKPLAQASEELSKRRTSEWKSSLLVGGGVFF